MLHVVLEGEWFRLGVALLLQRLSPFGERFPHDNSSWSKLFCCSTTVSVSANLSFKIPTSD